MDSDTLLKIGYSPRLLRPSFLSNAEIDLKSAIVDGNLESVASIIEGNPALLRSDIRTKSLGALPNKWTPLHYACYNNQEKIVEFLIEKEKSRMKTQIPGGYGATNEECDQTPSYNMRSSADRTPIFYTLSTKIVEMVLSHFDDLEVTGEYGMPLLWKCADWGGVSTRVAQDYRLLGQYGQRWEGSLPLETAMNHGSRSSLESCIELVRGLRQCSSNVKAMNLRALLGNWEPYDHNPLLRPMIQEEILKATWELVQSWLNCEGKSTILTEDEELRLRAALAKARGMLHGTTQTMKDIESCYGYFAVMEI